MNWSKYRQLDAVNASSLKWAAVSPKHYLYHKTHDRPDTPAMQLGRAVHCSVLEPDEFPRRYTLWAGHKRGKDWQDFDAAATAAGLEVLNTDQYGTALAIRDAVRSHLVACDLIESGPTEQTLEWADPGTGLGCKARVDVLSLPRGLVIDLKTARSIDPRQFERATHDLLYHVQAAHYVAGCTAKYGGEWGFAFVAVESAPPFDVRAGRLSEDALYAGEQERQRLLRLVRDCTESGEWPGAYLKESEFDLPAWYYAAGESVMEATL